MPCGMSDFILSTNVPTHKYYFLWNTKAKEHTVSATIQLIEKQLVYNFITFWILQEPSSAFQITPKGRGEMNVSGQDFLHLRHKYVIIQH